MATPKEPVKSITELEKELQLVKESLNQLKVGATTTSTKKTSKTRSPVKRKTTKRTTTSRQAKTEEVSKSVEQFSHRLQELVQFNQERVEAASQLKESFIQERLLRINWLKDFFSEFKERFEAQCEKDRQKRLETLESIRQHTMQIIGRAL